MGATATLVWVTPSSGSRVHAWDMATGHEKMQGLMRITALCGMVAFVPRTHLRATRGRAVCERDYYICPHCEAAINAAH